MVSFKKPEEPRVKWIGSNGWSMIFAIAKPSFLYRIRGEAVAAREAEEEEENFLPVFSAHGMCLRCLSHSFSSACGSLSPTKTTTAFNGGETVHLSNGGITRDPTCNGLCTVRANRRSFFKYATSASPAAHVFLWGSFNLSCDTGQLYTATPGNLEASGIGSFYAVEFPSSDIFDFGKTVSKPLRLFAYFLRGFHIIYRIVFRKTL